MTRPAIRATVDKFAAGIFSANKNSLRFLVLLENLLAKTSVHAQVQKNFPQRKLFALAILLSAEIWTVENFLFIIRSAL